MHAVVRRWLAAAIVSAAAAGAVTGCAARHPVTPAGAPADHQRAAGSSSAAADSAAPVSVPLAIENHNWLDVTVFIVASGIRTRLGTVSGSTSETLTVPYRHFAVLGDVHLVAELVGGRTARGGSISSQTISVRPGQSIVWTIETDLARSVLAVE